MWKTSALWTSTILLLALIQTAACKDFVPVLPVIFPVPYPVASSTELGPSGGDVAVLGRIGMTPMADRHGVFEPHVLRMVHRQKVVWVYTRPVCTRVVENNSFRYVSVLQSVGDPVGRYVPRPTLHVAIATSRPSSSPDPTPRRCLHNLFPESLGNCFEFSYGWGALQTGTFLATELAPFMGIGEVLVAVGTDVIVRHRHLRVTPEFSKGEAGLGVAGVQPGHDSRVLSPQQLYTLTTGNGQRFSADQVSPRITGVNGTSARPRGEGV